MGMVERNNSFPVCQSVTDSEGNVCVCKKILVGGRCQAR